MSRTKIEVDVSVLLKRRALRVNVSESSTCGQVVRKALDKCHVMEPPLKYQLWALGRTPGKEQVLRDEDRPTHVLMQWLAKREVPRFQLRIRTSGIIRIHHSLGSGLQTFQSLIVTPTMTTVDVTQIAVAKLAPQDAPTLFELVERTLHGERVLGIDERPLLLQSSPVPSQLEIRKKSDLVNTTRHRRQYPAPLPSIASPASLSSPTSLTPPTPPTALTSPASLNSSTSSTSSPFLTQSELKRGSLALHSSLIEALKLISSTKGEESRLPQEGTRELVLEQALVEQNQILDVMQELVASLEIEGKAAREKINAQSKALQDMTTWERRAKRAEEELKKRGDHVIGSADSGAISFAAISGFEKLLAEKDRVIALQQSQLAALPQSSRQRPRSDEIPTSALLASTRAKLEAERVRVIELEEELSVKTEKVNLIHSDLRERHSLLLNKESEIQYLRHQMDSLKQLGQQQQELVLQLRGSLADKGIQLSSLTRALSKEKQVSDAQRSSANALQSSLYEQILSRDLVALELKREDSTEEIGFSCSKMDLPVSSKVPCLIVKAVKSGSIAHGRVQPGDELLEVNGHSCRSLAQPKAMACLDSAMGIIRLVVARDSAPLVTDIPLHSTPVKSPTSSQSTFWATALSEPISSSLTTVSTIPLSPDVTSPGGSAMPSLFPLGSGPASPPDSPTQAKRGEEEEKGERENGEEEEEEEERENGEEEEEEEEEFAHLRECLIESEEVRMELEGQLDIVREELDNLQMEHDLVKAENFDLQQQLGSRESEMDDTWTRVAEMEQMLVTVQEQVATDERKISSLEARNQSLATQLENAEVSYKSLKMESSEALETAERTSRGSVESVKELRETQNRLTSEVEQLQSDVALQVSQVTELKKELETEQEARKREEEKANSQNLQLQSELQSLQESMAKSLALSQGELEQVRKQLGSAKTLLMQAEMRESEMEVKTRHLQQAADAANHQLEERDKEYKKVREEMNGYREIAEKKTLEMENLTLGLKATQNKLEASKQTLLRLQNEVDNLRRNNAKLQAENNKLDGAQERAKRRASTAESEVKFLGEKLESSVEEKNVLFQQLEESVEKETVLEQELEEVRTRLREAQGDSSVARQRESQLQGAQLEVEKELETRSKRIEELDKRCSKLNDANKMLGGKLEVAQRETEVAKAEVERLKSAQQENEDQVLEGQLELAQLTRELELKRQDLLESAAVCEQLREELVLERGRAEKQRETFERLQVRVESLEGHKKKGEDMVSSMEFVHEQDQRRNKHLEETLEKRAEELEKTRRELGSLQAETQSKLSQLLAENASQKGSIEQLKLQLKDRDSSHHKEKSVLGEKQRKLEHDLRGLKEELQAERSAGSINQATISQLRGAMEELESERDMAGVQIREASKKSAKLGEEKKKLVEELTRVKLNSEELTSTNASLTTESNILRQQVADSAGRMDEMRESLRAMEQQLKDAVQSLQESKAEEKRRGRELESLQSELEEKEKELVRVRKEGGDSALELHSRDEQLSQLMAAMKLKQSECEQLRQSVVTAQKTTSSREKKLKLLEVDKHRLQESVEELQSTQNDLQGSMARAESERVFRADHDENTIRRLREENDALKLHSKDLESQVVKLQTAHSEAQSTADQLLAAQEALKSSLNSLGSEKEVEVLGLSDQITKLEASLLHAKRELQDSNQRESKLDSRVQEMEGQTSELSSQCRELEEENRKLQTEIEVHRKTHSQLSELHNKVGSLEENLRTKTEHVSALEGNSRSMEGELRVVKAENQGLLEKVSELVNLKVSLAEQSSLMQHVQGDLAAEVRAREAMVSERDQLMAVLRKLEVEKHTEAPPPTEVVEGTPREQLMDMLKDKEEEAFRLREYVGKLLSAVVEKAPFVLEKMH